MLFDPRDRVMLHVSQMYGSYIFNITNTIQPITVNYYLNHYCWKESLCTFLSEVKLQLNFLTLDVFMTAGFAVSQT